MECKVAIVKIHQYLDGELPREEKLALHNHMNSCDACRERLEQLEKTDAAMFQTLTAVGSTASYSSADSLRLKECIMGQLPQRKKKERNRFVRLLYRYPGAAAAAIFIVVMLGSFIASWEQDAQLIVSGDVEALQQLVYEGNNTVIIPEGVNVVGNLTVENGKVEVQGTVDGNVTVIDGSMVLASTGHIAGQSRTIDRALDWFWYKVTSTVGSVISQ